MNYWKEFFGCITKHLGQIPYIVFSPIAIVLQLLYELIVTPYKLVCEKINKEEFVRRRTARNLQRIVSSILHGHSNLLNSFQSRHIAKLFTFLLQSISFVTTYAGFAFFLGPVNPIAPLFMAITVQGTCFYLLNYTSSQKRIGGWKRFLLLCILIAISTVTSYMGIFDSVVKPVDQMSAQYNKYVSTVNNLIDEEIAQNYSYSISYRDIEKVFDQFNSTIKDADAIISNLNETNDKIKTFQTVPFTWVDENNIVRYGTKQVPLEEASNVKVENDKQIANIEYYKNKVAEFLSTEISADDVLSAVTFIIEDPDKLDSSSDKDKKIYNQFITAIDNLNQLSQILSGEQDSNGNTVVYAIEIEEAINHAQKREKLHELRLPEYEALISNSVNKGAADSEGIESKLFSAMSSFFENLNEFVVSDELMRAEEIREILAKTSENSYAKLHFLLSQDNQVKLEQSKGYLLYENTQIMPFTLPFNQEKGLAGEAFFSFAVALLVDLLSLLISWALIVKSKSILYYNNLGEVRKNREERIENCLMYICLSGMPADLTNSDQIREYVVTTVNGALGNLLDKVKYIYVPDELNSFAYLSFSDISKDDRNEKLLFQALNNAALLYPFHKSELSAVLQKEFGGSKNDDANKTKALLDKYSSVFKDDEVYYLVSKNFHSWFCENLSELLQNSKTFTQDNTDMKGSV